MNSSNLLSRQGHRLLQIGVALFLFTSFEGFVIPYLAAPVLGRSAHSLCALFGRHAHRVCRRRAKERRGKEER
jgi:hydroxylaminobenzene mutase